MREPNVDYTTIPLKCPRCGLHGWVLLSRVDRRFRCKQCRTKFYINLVGDVVLGDPPVRSHAAPPIDPLGAIAATWSRMPRAGRFVLVVAIAVLGVAAVKVLFPRESGIPDELPERARFVGLAFAQNEPARLKELAAPGSYPLVAEWVRLTRPESWDEVLATGAEVQFRVVTSLPNYQKGTAYVLGQIVFISAAGRDGDGTDSAAHEPVGQGAIVVSPRDDSVTPIQDEFPFVTFWLLNKNGAWLLDGERTRKAVNRGRSRSTS